MRTYQGNLSHIEINLICRALENDKQRHQDFLDEVTADIMKEVNYDSIKFEDAKLKNEFYNAAIKNIEAHKKLKSKMFQLHDKYWDENNEN